MAFFKPTPTFPSTPTYNPIYSAANGVSGFEIKVTGPTTFTVNRGCARAVTVDANIVFSGVAPTQSGLIEVDIQAVGLNGVYPNSIASLGLANDTMFPVYAIMQSSGFGLVNGLPTMGVVVCTGNNFLPPGFVAENGGLFRRIGWAYVSASTGELIPFIQTGSFGERNYQFNSAVRVLEAVPGSTVDTNVSLSAGNLPIVPFAMSSVSLTLAMNPSAIGDFAAIKATGSAETDPSKYVFLVVSPTADGPIFEATPMVPGTNAAETESSITYINNSATLTMSMNLTSFVDNLRLDLVQFVAFCEARLYERENWPSFHFL
jgi:hypothetical protein